MRFQAPRGTQDVLPGDAFRWHHVESTFRSLVHRYGYQEIRTPTFEDTQLFLRGVGETTEVVSKQMYDFIDKGGRSITLKPEGTAPAMRSLIENNLAQPGIITKVYYITPVFRYERPQKGRLREHHQVGLELVGANGPAADAEVIEIAVRFYQSLGLKNFQVLLNSLGRTECRLRYRDALLEFAADYLAGLDIEAQERIRKNPLRMMDSKEEEVIELMKGAPKILDYLESDSAERFQQVQTMLSTAGVPFEVAPNIVRGLDYYTDTVFELQVTNIGAQSAIGGGGRYDNLIKEIGGGNVPSVGFGIGIERALLALEAEGIEIPEPRPDAFIVSAGDHHEAVDALARRLREGGFTAIVDLDRRSLKGQLKMADRSNCRFSIIMGDDEANGGYLTVRDMSISNQVAMSEGELIEALKQK